MLFNKKTPIVVTLLLLTFSQFSQATPIDALTYNNSILMRSSGVNLFDNIDQSYQLNTYNNAPLIAEMSLTSAFFLSTNNVNSGWISHIGNTGVGSLTLSATTVLDLSNVDLSLNNFFLSGYWLSDNQGLDILVNGISTGQTNLGNHYGLPTSSIANMFEISSTVSSLTQGLNIIEFLWGNNEAGNAPWPSSSPVSLRVELDSFTVAQKQNASPVPEPTSYLLFLIALWALIMKKNAGSHI